MEVCAEILANIQNDDFTCKAISLTDEEFEKGTIQVLCHQRGGWVVSENGNFR